MGTDWGFERTHRFRGASRVGLVWVVLLSIRSAGVFPARLSRGARTLVVDLDQRKKDLQVSNVLFLVGPPFFVRRRTDHDLPDVVDLTD